MDKLRYAADDNPFPPLCITFIHHWMMTLVSYHLDDCVTTHVPIPFGGHVVSDELLEIRLIDCGLNEPQVPVASVESVVVLFIHRIGEHHATTYRSLKTFRFTFCSKRVCHRLQPKIQRINKLATKQVRERIGWGGRRSDAWGDATHPKGSGRQDHHHDEPDASKRARVRAFDAPPWLCTAVWRAARGVGVAAWRRRAMHQVGITHRQNATTITTITTTRVRFGGGGGTGRWSQDVPLGHWW